MIVFDYHDTFHIKEIIKKYGGEWNSNKKKWYIKRKNYNSLFNEINKDLFVPFDPPISFEEFLKNNKSYIDQTIRIAKTKNDEKWNTFLIQINKIYK
jgi:hypothetical protein